MGSNILDLMYSENVSVILLDVFQPGMDGIETLKAIKRVSPETLVDRHRRRRRASSMAGDPTGG